MSPVPACVQKKKSVCENKRRQAQGKLQACIHARSPANGTYVRRASALKSNALEPVMMAMLALQPWQLRILEAVRRVTETG